MLVILTNRQKQKFCCLFGCAFEFVFGLFCRLHGNVESLAILSQGGADNYRRRDSIILAFEDAKISVLEFDDSIHGLRIT